MNSFISFKSNSQFYNAMFLAYHYGSESEYWEELTNEKG